MVVRYLLIAAMCLGVAADGFFAVVNFYPVAPHARRGRTRYVVMRLDDDQAAWFRSNILADFNTEANADVRLIAVDDEEQLQSAALDAARQGKDVVLVELPTTQLPRARATHFVRSFSAAIGGRRIRSDFAALGDAVLAPGKLGGEQMFLPRMALVDVAVYRASKVRDAVLHWSELRPQIDAALRAVNGRGLPAGYDLDLSPSSWDAYDRFVLAYYWAHRSYHHQPVRPRVAHRTGDDIDGQLDIAAGVYQAGATDATFAATDSPAARDYFQWEALYRVNNLYPDAMYGREPYGDEELIGGLVKGELFLATIDSMEAFDIHGGAYAGAIAHAEDPSDLEFTEVPSAASLELDARGTPVRRHDSFSFREDWVWALPATARGTDVAYQLVRFLWRPEIHARECEAFGMMPLHPEVVAERVSRFRLEWMSHVFEASLDQARHGEPVPDALAAKGLGSIYAQLWTKLVAGGVPPVPASGLDAVQRAPPPPRPLAVEPSDAATEPAPALAGSGEAKDQAAPPPEGQVGDWETGAVLDDLDAGAGSASAGSAGSAAGSAARTRPR